MKSLFTSKREKQLWIWVAVIMMAIYSTLGLAGQLANELVERRMLNNIFFYTFLVTVAIIMGIGLRWRPGQREIFVVLGAMVVYIMVFLRMNVGPAERTHIFEYGIVAAIVYQALLERKQNDAKVRFAGLSAIGITWALCWIDELIQIMIPNRVYDIRDVIFNLVGSVLAVLTSIALMWARSRFPKS